MEQLVKEVGQVREISTIHLNKLLVSRPPEIIRIRNQFHPLLFLPALSILCNGPIP